MKAVARLLLIIFFFTTLLISFFVSIRVLHAQNFKSWGLVQTEALRANMALSSQKDVLVSIIDTGLDISHPALKDCLWNNPGESGLDQNGQEKAKNGIDDDNNGYIDDIHGWNFVDNNNQITDNHGHGTHIAGIICQTAPIAKLIILKYYDPRAQSQNNLLNTVKAIKYATQMQAQLINYSGGGLIKNTAEEDAIRKAAEKNILFVAAAGNEKSDSDSVPFYPADYSLPNIISVAANDQNKKILDSSNYGEKSVDLSAPGKNIYSTLPGGGFGLMTGTSQATAFVSGAAVLIIAQSFERQSPEKILRQLVAPLDEVKNITKKIRHNVVVNAYRSVATRDSAIGAFGTEPKNLREIDSAIFSSDAPPL